MAPGNNLGPSGPKLSRISRGCAVNVPGNIPANAYLGLGGHFSVLPILATLLGIKKRKRSM